MMWRLPIVIFSSCIFLTLIGFSFWQQDWQYSLPTPRPQDLAQPKPGQVVDLVSTLVGPDLSRPTFLHFFNPACPCSRFNVDHIRSLVRSHSHKVRFIAVLQGDDTNLTRHFKKLGLNMESVVDSDGSIAKATGVYSTPQAVLIDKRGRLYYRGNYNSSRYCTTKNTEFARIALEALETGKAPPPISSQAIVSFGCPLPKKKAIRKDPKS